MATKRTRRRGRGRRALMLIAVLLAGSGLLRLTDGTGLAVAREVEALAKSSPTTQPASPGCTTEAEIETLLTTLLAREERLKDAEAELAHQQRTVAVAKQEIHDQLARLEAAESALRQTMALADQAAEKDLSRLTSVYENMKPADAAALFEAMAPEFAAGFLGRMRPDAAALVMAGLPSERAYAISVILAGRNAEVPTE